MDIRNHGGNFGGGGYGKWETMAVTASSDLASGAVVTAKSETTDSFSVKDNRVLYMSSHGYGSRVLKVKLTENKYFCLMLGWSKDSVAYGEIIQLSPEGIPTSLNKLTLSTQSEVFAVVQVAPTKIVITHAVAFGSSYSTSNVTLIDVTNDVISVVKTSKVDSYSGSKNMGLTMFEDGKHGVLSVCFGGYANGYSDKCGLYHTTITFNDDFTDFSFSPIVILEATTASGWDSYVYIFDTFRTSDNKVQMAIGHKMYVFTTDGAVASLESAQAFSTTSSGTSLGHGLLVETNSTTRILTHSNGFVSLEKLNDVWAITQLTSRATDFPSSFPNATFTGFDTPYGMVRPIEFDCVNINHPIIHVLEQGKYLITHKYQWNSTLYGALYSFCFNIGSAVKGIYPQISTRYALYTAEGITGFIQDGIVTMLVNEYQSNTRNLWYYVYNYEVNMEHKASIAGLSDYVVGVATAKATSGSQTKIARLVR